MFKKGDKVRCIEDIYVYLTPDKVYTVEGTTDDCVVIVSDIGENGYYQKCSFELVNEANIDDNDRLDISAVLGEAVFRGESMLTVNGVTFKVIKV